MHGCSVFYVGSVWGPTETFRCDQSTVARVDSMLDRIHDEKVSILVQILQIISQRAT